MPKNLVVMQTYNLNFEVDYKQDSITLIIEDNKATNIIEAD